MELAVFHRLILEDDADITTRKLHRYMALARTEVRHGLDYAHAVTQRVKALQGVV